MPAAATHVGFVDGDVQAGAAHRLLGGGEASGVAELGDDRRRNERADAVVAHQRPAARLAASEAPQLKIEGVDLVAEVLDDAQRDGDLLLGDRGKLEVSELLMRGSRVQARQAPGLHGDTVVKQDSVDALQPLRGAD